ncbi:MAG TPA: hypothetical protein V6D05_13900 [Stenomitos sp.]
MPERILSRERPQSTPDPDAKGRILMRVDPAAFGRFTRWDLNKQGYDVTSVHRLTADLVERQNPDTILFFHHTDEPLPLETLQSLPPDMPVIVATVGTKEPDLQLVEFAQHRGYTLLSSRMGPNLHVVLRTLKSIHPN